MMIPPKHQQGQGNGIVETVASNNTEFVNLTDAAERDDTDQTPTLLSHQDAMREEIHCSKRMWRKKVHRQRKIRRSGWAQATAMSVLLLSTFLSSVICSEIDTDHSTLLSRSSSSGMLQNLFGSSAGEQEAHQQQLDDEPPTRKGMLRRTVEREDDEQQHRILRQEEISTREHLARKNRRIRIEENNLAKERLARQRQARIARGRRMRQDQILPGDGAMLPQTNEVLAIKSAVVAEDEGQPRHFQRMAKLYTFAY